LSEGFATLRAGVALTLVLLLAACGDDGDSSDGDDGTNDPGPIITDAERALLETLSPAELPPPPPDTSNAWADDPDAALLGQRLFFEGGYSGELLDGDNDGTVNALGMQGETGKVSCAGCHVPESGFSDTRSIQQQTSLGAGWGLRKAPSLLDVGQSKLLMWDGRRDALYNQPFGVIESEVEANSSRLYAANHAFTHYRADYERLFGAMPPLDDTSRFPPLAANETGCRRLDDRACPTPMRGAPGDGAEYDGLSPEDQEAVTRVVANLGKAMGAYQRKLTCGPSRFDRWMHGDESALSATEQRGAVLFVGKARCIECHSGPYFSDEKFHNVGLKPDYVATVFLDDNDPGAAVGLESMMSDPLNVQGEYSDGDDGRIPEAVRAEDLGAFRTPRLRCASMRPSFMHTAHIRTLADVVAFFNRGGDDFGYPGQNVLQALDMTPDERADLVAFLEALEGPGPEAALLAPL
jgi:cytochrome c peroxidase